MVTAAEKILQQSRPLSGTERLLRDIGVDRRTVPRAPAITERAKPRVQQFEFPEQKEISRLEREISTNRADVQGTRTQFERRLKVLRATLQGKRAARSRREQKLASGTKLTTAEKVAERSVSLAEFRGLTPAQTVSRIAKRDKAFRKQAGVTSSDTPAQISGKIRRLQKQQRQPQKQPTPQRTRGSGAIATLPEKRKGLSGVAQRLENRRRTLERQLLTATGVREQRIKSQLTLLGVGVSAVSTATAISRPVETIKGTGQFAKETLRFFGRKTKVSPGAPLGKILSKSPDFSIGLIGGELVTLKGGSLLIAKVPPRIKSTLVKLFDPKFKDLRLTPSGKLAFDVPKESGGFKTITLGGTVDELSESLSKQAALAGEKVDAISASTGLFNLLERKKTIDKPRAPGAPPLEETFFADPRGRLRPSRLGLSQKEANLLDILSDDFTFKKSKPQAIFFEDVTVAKFPPGLRQVQRKLLAGETLTALEEQKLLNFQLTATGEFKPIGFLGREPEIVLAKGNIIRRKKTSARVIIQGRVVPIIRTEIVRDAKLSKLVDKVVNNKATAKEKALLKRETGIDFSSITRGDKKFVSPSGLSGSLASRISRPSRLTTLSGLPSLASRTKSKVSRSPTLKSTSLIPSPTSVTRRTTVASRLPGVSGTSGVSRASVARVSPRSPVATAKVPKPFRFSGVKKKGPLANGGVKAKQGYSVLYKVKGKFKKINRKPITKQQALDLGFDVTDHSLANTLRIRKAKGKVVAPRFRIKKGYATANKAKFRDFRIRKGKKIKLVNTFIEKRGRARLDKISERRKLTAAGYLARIRKRTFSKVKPLIRLRRGK